MCALLRGANINGIVMVHYCSEEVFIKNCTVNSTIAQYSFNKFMPFEFDEFFLTVKSQCMAEFSTKCKSNYTPYFY